MSLSSERLSHATVENLSFKFGIPGGHALFLVILNSRKSVSSPSFKISPFSGNSVLLSNLT